MNRSAPNMVCVATVPPMPSSWSGGVGEAATDKLQRKCDLGGRYRVRTLYENELFEYIMMM